MILDAVRSGDDRRSLELFFARAAMGRPFVAPPGIPADRLLVLRQAFEATLRDPAFLDDARKQNLNVAPVSGQAMFDLVASAYRTPPEIVNRTLKALGRAN